MKKIKLIKPFVLWFTGLPCSGKTTTSRAVKKLLEKEFGIVPAMLDGDEFRKTVSSDLGFSEKDRIENNRRVINFSKLLIEQGIPVLVSFVSPLNSIRKMARTEIPNYIEIFVDSPLALCIKRDVKGHYKKAMKKKIKDMTGIDAGFEKPQHSDIVITPDKTLAQNTKLIINYLKEKGYIFFN